MLESKNAVTKLARFDECVDTLLEEFAKRQPKRTGSLLVSVFGDAITPHGGSVWLGSLINALEPFGVNQRLVRTSVFRLSKDGWLSSEQIGRRSYYSLTETGQRQFSAASQRIYSEPRHEWRGTWNLVLLSGIDANHRDEARRRLSWLGFAPFSANLMAHPAADEVATADALKPLDGYEQMLFLKAKVDESRQDYLRELVQKAWSLDELANRYKEFLERFRPAYRAARAKKRLDPCRAFQARTMLIHEYRRVLLRDPLLPDVLLPGRWGGISAYQLCRNFYKLLAAPAATFLQENMESADGPLAPPESRFYTRFNGLPKQTKRKKKRNE